MPFFSQISAGRKAKKRLFSAHSLVLVRLKKSAKAFQASWGAMVCGGGRSLLQPALRERQDHTGTRPLTMSATGTALAVPCMGSHMNMSQRWVRMPYSTLSTNAKTKDLRSGEIMLSGAHLKYAAQRKYRQALCSLSGINRA
jgi:hypothetical protein